MAIAAAHTQLLSLILRESDLNYDIMKINNLKRLAVYESSDANNKLSAEKNNLRRIYKAEFEANPGKYANCDDYTDITEYEEALDIATTAFNNELERINEYEEFLNRKLTVDSAELQEVQVEKDSLENTIKGNIDHDFAYGLNG